MPPKIAKKLVLGDSMENSHYTLLDMKLWTDVPYADQPAKILSATDLPLEVLGGYKDRCSELVNLVPPPHPDLRCISTTSSIH